jgi:hypothetical protein
MLVVHVFRDEPDGIHDLARLVILEAGGGQPARRKPGRRSLLIELLVMHPVVSRRGGGFHLDDLPVGKGDFGEGMGGQHHSAGREAHLPREQDI